MLKNTVVIVLSISFLFLTSCASIVSKSSYPITINSSPSEAKVVITDKNGLQIFAGNTPATLSLKSGSGFFGKARYQIKLTKKGYESKIIPIESSLDGWYFGNILFGGLIGMLIVDPATGAMYKLDTQFINETLIKLNTTSSLERKELKVYTLNEIPKEWKNHLVEVK